MACSLDLKFVNDSVEFYKPLCMSGYLTPLQRKKLREKRNWDNSECKETVDLKKLKKFKRSQIHHEISKIKKPKIVKHRNKKAKVSVPQVQCVVSKIMSKTADDTHKERKFFKTSSSTRLENICFTMPLIAKRNSILISAEKNANIVHKNQMITSVHLSEMSANKNNDIVSKEYVSPCIVKIVAFEHNTSESQSSEIVGDTIKESTRSCSENNETSKDMQFITPPKKEISLFDFDWPSDDVLLQRQELARSTKKSNVLKESNSLKEVDDGHKMTKDNSAVKFYPIFNFANKKLKMSKQIQGNDKQVVKFIKDSSKGGEQMIIDAGQKEIGPKVCKTCNMIYMIGQEEDEGIHSNYHTKFLINLKFPGWKEENVIGEYCDGRVIMVRKSDKGLKLKKIEDILLIANKDLGFSCASVHNKPDVTFVLFISNEKKVAGCIAAEPISFGYKVLLASNKSQLHSIDTEKVWRIGNWYSSSESVPSVCGINRIWVSQEYRRRKVASRMVDCLRCNFLHGHVVGIHELAFTDPSPDGREFAATYTGTDHFLVYK